MAFRYKVTWKPAHIPEDAQRGRAGHAVRAIVHHRMVGYLPGTDRVFSSVTNRRVSTHFGIGTRTPGGPVEISQYVDLSDTAYGNGDVDPTGPIKTWPIYAAEGKANPNYYTVSIEHQDGGAAGRGVVTPAIIAASIALDRLLLGGSLDAIRAAGIHCRNAATATQLHRITTSKVSLIDHHVIAGRLKPYCWRPWLDDHGFPQALYLAKLAGL